MFEINLVPDIKGELLKKQRARNLVIFISIVVAAGSAGLMALFGMIVTGQNLVMTNQDREIQCRSEGVNKEITNCSNDYGTAVMKIANLNEYLTIQDQMSKLAEINDNKLLLSRVFGVLDVILPAGDDVVRISELSVNMPNGTLTFDAQGDSVSQIDYRALEVFKNTVSLSYYDYGRYMRYDGTAGEYVEIPTTCITETTEGGVAYGVYHKGAPGCEAPLLSDDEATETVTEGDAEDVETAAAVVDIKIQRIYRTEDEMRAYQEQQNDEDGVRYYFESECAAYGSDGRLNEEATRANCKLSEEPPLVRDSSNGRDSEGNLVLRFSSTVTLNKEVFRFMNKHMRIIGPTRQNVTDSYTQIRDMFAEPATGCAPEDTQCLQQEVPADGS